MFDFDDWIEDPNEEEIEYNSGIEREECFRCHGSGYIGLNGYQCPECHGTGFIIYRNGIKF